MDIYIEKRQTKHKTFDIASIGMNHNSAFTAQKTERDFRIIEFFKKSWGTENSTAPHLNEEYTKTSISLSLMVWLFCLDTL